MEVAEGTQIEVTPAQRHIIRRPRLERLLDETSARVILLVAPAGYGKTTLARQWLEDKPHVWYQATPASADVAALAAGLSPVLPAENAAARDRLTDLLRAGADTRETAEGAVAVLVGRLSDSSGLPILMVDDYQHLIGSDLAEYVFEQLVEQTSLRLIFSSRLRPSWATPRRILYGEFHEVPRSALAFSTDEAVAVLAHDQSDDVAGLLALAEGWPAVIGLAALTRVWLGAPSALPDALHDYFAEELFQGLSTDVALALCQLSTAPRISLAFLEHLFAHDAAAISKAGVASGFLTPRGHSDYDLHPLLRSFLERKLREHGAEATRAAAASTAEFLLERRDWDEAFAVIDHFEQADLLSALLSSAMDELLAVGRLATLERWVTRGKALDVPVATVAEAELSFRRGAYLRAESSALDALSRLEPGDRFISRCWLRAGNAAYFRDELKLALERLEQARETAVSVDDLAAALGASFTASIEAENEDAREYLAALRQLPAHRRDDPLLVARSELFLAARFDGVRTVTPTLAGALNLLQTIRDPLARSGFLNTAACTLVMAGRYGRALELVDQELAEALDSNLAFVEAHARMNRANALIGLRRLSEAEDDLARAQSLGSGDIYVTVNCAVIALRLAIAYGKQRRALRSLDEHLASSSAKAMYGECLALAAVANASCSEADEAERLAGLALSVTKTVEPRVLAACARSINALTCGTSDLPLQLAQLASLIESTGMMDSFVVGYRACPSLLRSLLAQAPHLHDSVTSVVREARDTALLSPDSGRRSGIVGSSSLSKREREVLALLAEGLTNREIAGRLYISEFTAKVHVRRILAKLGVQSRTQAAILAAAELKD